MNRKTTGTSMVVYILCFYLGLLYCIPVAYGASANFSISIQEPTQQQSQDPPAQQSSERTTQRSGGSKTWFGYTPPSSDPAQTSAPPAQNELPPLQQFTIPPASPPEFIPLGEQGGFPDQESGSSVSFNNTETQEYDEPLDAILVVTDTEEALDNKISEFGVNADLPLIIAVSITLVSVGLGISGAGNLTGLSNLHLPF